MDLREYTALIEGAEEDFRRSAARYGLPFEKDESSPRSARQVMAHACGCACENGGSSIWRGWISPACIACRTGERTGSLFVDLRCTKHCYFCFNVNQPHYERYLQYKRDIALELRQAHAAGAAYDFLAVTGGEPLLHVDSVVAFLDEARSLYPQIHMRIYTNGDRADEDALARLAATGLSEIRFSVKPPDDDDAQERALAAIGRAVSFVDDVVVEMPVIPGTGEWMIGLLREFDALGVRGVNLLKFCFPLHNAEQFVQRGFRLRRHPWNYLYDYWYSGGLPVAESERDALCLMQRAADEGLSFGLHYCSADNRNSAQVNRQNDVFFVQGLDKVYPWIDRDDDDGFLRCLKVFGEDVPKVRAWAEACGVACYANDAVPSLSLPRSVLDALRVAYPGVQVGKSTNILEELPNGDYCMREIGVRELYRS